MDWIKNKKAMSPILALLIVLGVTIVVGAVFYAWGSGMFDSTQEKTQSAMEGQAATMSNDIAPYFVKVGIVGYDKEPATFEYVSTGVDADNDKAIEPLAQYKPDTYVNCTRDERVIFEVPVYVRNNAQDKTLKGVTAKVLGLSGHLWYALHMTYDETNDQYILCNGDDTEFVGFLYSSGAVENPSGLKYVFTTSSYAIDMTKDGYNYNTTSGQLDPASAGTAYHSYYDAWYSTVQYFTSKASSSFADNVQGIPKLVSSNGASYYIKATNDTNTYYINGYKVFGYSAIKALNAPTYTIGDISPNTMKSVNAYVMFYSIPSEYLPDVEEVSIKIQDSEGILSKTVPLKFHIEDPEWA